MITKTTPQATISLEKASELLNMTPEELTALCDEDTGFKFHHRTIFSSRIRFRKNDIIRIRKMLTVV